MLKQSGLLESLEALGEGVVMGTAATANGGHDTGFAESLRDANAEILNAAVAVIDQFRHSLTVARVDLYLNGVERAVTAQCGLGLPIDD